MAIDQHAVVTLTMHFKGVTMLGIICDSGVNPMGMAPHTPKGNGFLTVKPNLTQLTGCARFYCFGYQLAQLS